MASFKMLELVLLGCEFEMWPGGSEPPAEEAGADPLAAHDPLEIFEYPAGDFLFLDAKTTRHEDEIYLLFLRAGLEEDAMPFHLEVTLGVRFQIDTEEGEALLEPHEVESTLVWLCYPYLRETIAAITGRSPLPPYVLPPIVRMPDPSVLKRTEPGE